MPFYYKDVQTSKANDDRLTLSSAGIVPRASIL